MNDMMQVLLVSDMDGTLLRTDQSISLENQNAVKRFVDSGGLFTVATGRNETSVERFLNVIPINAPAILYNGSVIYDFATGKRLLDKRLPDRTIEVIDQLMKYFPQIGIEVYCEGKIYFPKENAITRMHQSREGFIPLFIQLRDMPLSWNKVVLAIDPDDISEIGTFIKYRFTHLFDVVQSESQFLEILPKGSNKGTALKILANILSIDLSHIISVGDNMNDLEMICNSGLGFAVENAHPDLISSADFICSGNNDHALADLIKKVENILAVLD